MSTVTGGCFCGQVRYAITQPVIASVNCHCTMCRKTSGAAFVSWLVVPDTQFAYTSGQPKLLQSSEEGQRWFCDVCGTPLTCVNQQHPQYVDVTIGTLDEPNDFPPTKDYYADTRLDWISALPEPKG